MLQDRVEEYLGAVYRLRADVETPLPLSQLAEYFGFSPVSVHEMIQKLDKRGWVIYHPYRGVTLTASGEQVARSVLRRHRLWERFLTDELGIPWEEAHSIAGRLEHVATELVTERLASFLGEPDACPHGGPIPPAVRSATERCLASVPVGARARIARIAPETSDLLRRIARDGLTPGRDISVVSQEDVGPKVRFQDDATVQVSAEDAAAIWVDLA